MITPRAIRTSLRNELVAVSFIATTYQNTKDCAIQTNAKKPYYHGHSFVP